MRNKFRFYSDPGHGWMAVTIDELKELGIENLITSCSYKRGSTAYLEEDQDASTFIHAYQSKYGSRPEFEEVMQERTPIRYYHSYTQLSK